MNVLNLNLNSFEKMCKKKCAEVFYQNVESFSIVCTQCELQTMKFDDFLKHFKEIHVFQENEMFETTSVTIKHEKDMEDSCNSINEEPIDPIELTCAQLFEGDIKCENDSENESEFRLELSTESEEDNVPLKLLGDKTLRKKRINRADRQTDHTCNDCGRVYKSRKALSRHIRSKHTKNQTYPEAFQCASCDKTYFTKASLQAHARMKHRSGKNGSEPGNYPCTKCDKTYSDKYSLKDHLLRHLGQRNFHCEVPGCSRTFFNRKNLNFHVRNIHVGEKNFVCEVCGYSTKTAASLAMHKRTHTGEKPFNCLTCGKAFATQSGVREHMVTHAVNERPHVCNICGKTFARPKALYHHKPLHSDVKKFVCKICGKAYAQQAGLSAHKRQHLVTSKTACVLDDMVKMVEIPYSRCSVKDESLAYKNEIK